MARLFSPFLFESGILLSELSLPEKVRKKVYQKMSFSRIANNSFFFSSFMGQRGRRYSSVQKPVWASRALMGIGFTSLKIAFIRGKSFSCKSIASFVLPANQSLQISLVSLGKIFDKTEITPLPPRDKVGKIRSSLPL